jgi:hypothetical protein
MDQACSFLAGFGTVSWRNACFVALKCFNLMKWLQKRPIRCYPISIYHDCFYPKWRKHDYSTCSCRQKSFIDSCFYFPVSSPILIFLQSVAPSLLLWKEYIPVAPSARPPAMLYFNYESLIAYYSELLFIWQQQKGGNPTTYFANVSPF